MQVGEGDDCHLHGARPTGEEHRDGDERHEPRREEARSVTEVGVRCPLGESDWPADKGDGAEEAVSALSTSTTWRLRVRRPCRTGRGRSRRSGSKLSGRRTPAPRGRCFSPGWRRQNARRSFPAGSKPSHRRRSPSARGRALFGQAGRFRPVPWRARRLHERRVGAGRRFLGPARRHRHAVGTAPAPRALAPQGTRSRGASGGGRPRPAPGVRKHARVGM
jgi:hypothetical protein